MTDMPQVLLAHHLKALKLPTFLREYDKLARQCAADGVDHSRFLRPELERDADDLVTLLQQQCRRGGGVHSPAHAANNARALFWIHKAANIL